MPAPILFTHYGEEWIRGSERCLLDLLTYIDRDRFQPVVWCNAETLAAEVRALNVPVHISRFSALFNWEPPRYDVRNYLGLVREGKRLAHQHGARVLHSNSAAPTQWLAPVAHSLKLPLLTHLHAPYVRSDRITLGVHLATLAVGVSNGCIAGLIDDGMPSDRMMTIYNGVDIAPWKNADQTQLRASLGIRPDEIVIVQAASLIHRKGQDILLHAFAELRRRRPHVRLLLVGEGPDRAAIEALRHELNLDDAVTMLGFVPLAGVVFRDAADIVVSPSRVEGFGLTVIEAGAAGCPVVASDAVGVNEIISTERNGLIVPIEDAVRLCDALQRMVDDRALRERLGNALHQDVEERYLISAYIRNFEAVYDKLLAVPAEQLGWRHAMWRGQFPMYARSLTDAARRRAARLLRKPA